MPIKNKEVLLSSLDRSLAMGTTEPVVFAQGATPPDATGVTNPDDPSSAVGNKFRGNGAGPIYSGPAAASGANSPTSKFGNYGSEDTSPPATATKPFVTRVLKALARSSSSTKRIDCNCESRLTTDGTPAAERHSRPALLSASKSRS
jgi:hypothetical protein